MVIAINIVYGIEIVVQTFKIILRVHIHFEIRKKSPQKVDNSQPK
jgi:hypothetical protein